ncbi:MAG: hypothetical protein C5B50_10375 [Verrucomicrobia bacterium]|nr:MAG: hypothetical protein C5B50_10375 [Verrucomicrobiota bacterium]
MTANPTITRHIARTANGLEGDKLTVVFTVHSSKKSRRGASLSGVYAIYGDEAVRKGGQWHLTGKIQWSKFPEGILDRKAAKELELENYVAEHDTLPPGMAAPDVEVVRMDDGKHLRLTNLLGKVVVLDFWAVGCGACQEPLRKMQKYLDDHAAWKGRVEVMPISIDSTLKEARNHLTRRCWTNTFNVWAGPGDWKSAPARAFRISGIPTCYIIDPKGTIVDAGVPPLIDVPEIVDKTLQR